MLLKDNFEYSGKSMSVCVLCCILVMFFQSSCKHAEEKGKIYEGEITYTITYIENTIPSVSTSLLPKKMVRKFRKDMISSSMEGFMGMFKIVTITDLRKNTNTTLLQVMDNKFCYTAPPGDYGCCFDPYEGIQIVFCPEKKEIAGFVCNRAIITAGSMQKDSVEIWYSPDIGPAFANQLSPFEPIDGMLMNFNLGLQNLKMRFTATEVKRKSMPRSQFSVKGEYIPVTRIRMEKIISALLE